ncbi:MAG: 3-deoxy-manno-octulosonate cytidylyltransferase [Proteobacteria bacterium]|nr:MAG: 3-deoxy-manno-octulosonate cytidylyltransferase [Pseudomonadota bacterium]
MISWNQWLIVVPARMQSTRLPRKPLADLGGKPMIVRVYERLKPFEEKGATLVIATDDSDILDVCQKHNVPALMTRVDHKSGTDRCAEVAKNFDKPFVLNVQGDEPFVNLEDLEGLLAKMEKDGDPMGTMVHRNEKESDYKNPNCVKAVMNDQGRALYFSRSPLPYYREPSPFVGFWQHIGVYAFTKKGLLAFCHLPQHPLEIAESLEQLRALGSGLSISMTVAKHPSLGIDTPQDLEAARARIR